jgi:hypothetical protein
MCGGGPPIASTCHPRAIGGSQDHPWRAPGVGHHGHPQVPSGLATATPRSFYGWPCFFVYFKFKRFFFFFKRIFWKGLNAISVPVVRPKIKLTPWFQKVYQVWYM